MLGYQTKGFTEGTNTIACICTTPVSGLLDVKLLKSTANGDHFMTSLIEI